MRNGMDCVINETGIAQVPNWKGIPDFNLEEDLAAADSFLLEPVVVVANRKGAPAPRSIGKAELSEMLESGGVAAASEHDEE